MIKHVMTGLAALGLMAYVSSVAAFCPNDCPHSKTKAALASHSAGEPATGEGKSGGCQHAAPAAAEEAAKSGGCQHGGAATADGAAKSGCCQKNKGAAVAGAEGSKPCAHVKKSGGCGSANPVDAVLASMPAMKYRVGTEETNCPNAAKAMAETTKGAAVQYVVGDEVFTEEKPATVKLASMIEKQIDDLKSVQFSVNGECMRCPMQAKEMAEKAKTQVAYKVGGFEFADREKAERASKAAAEAVTSVQLACKVDGQPQDCMKVSGGAAKISFVVGSDETESREQADLMVLQARARAVVEAVSAVFSA